MTQPVGSPPLCSVWIDGTRMADGQPLDNEADPTVLTDLSVVWGRSNNLDQPAPATCTFEVMDLIGGQTFAERLHIGARVDVRADATIYPDPTMMMLPDPGFELGTAAWKITNGIATIETAGADLVNLFTRPSFEDNITTGFAVTNGALSTPAASVPIPSAGARVMQAVASAGPGMNLSTATTLRVPVTLGKLYRISGYVRVAAGTIGSARAQIEAVYRSSTGTAVGSTMIGGSVALTTAWQRLTLSTIAAPAGAVTVSFVVNAYTGVTAGLSLHYDALMVNEIATAGDPTPNYFDGDTPANQSATYRWSGTARASTSIRSAIGGTVHGGSKALRIEPIDGSRLITIDFPPAPFSADPSAWNQIARAKVGQSWGYGGWVQLANELGVLSQLVTIKPIAYSNPNGSNPVVVPGSAPQLGPGGPAGWSQSVGTVLPPNDAWMGLRIEIYPSGPAWQDLASSITWASLGATPRWSDLSIIRLDDLSLTAPAGGAARAGLVFSGRITDLDARYDLSIGGTVVQVIAADNTAELANRYVGDQPWAASTLASRFQGIIDLSGQSIKTTVAASVGNRGVTFRDVDSQPSLRLLQELSASVAGVLWTATSLVTGPVLHLDDVAVRVPLKQLKMISGVVVIVVADPVPSGGVTISACNILLEPVRWHQATDDDATEVSVIWLEQTTDPDSGQPKPTQRTYTVSDPQAEIATGKRRIGISSQLANQPDAQITADAVLARSRTPGWRVSGLKWHLNPYEMLSPDDLDVIMAVLDGTTRMGLPIIVNELPMWSPISRDTDSVAVYLEGGRFTNHDGYWQLDLLVSDAASQGAAAVPWQSLPSDWSWDEFDAAIDWADLSGVGI